MEKLRLGKSIDVNSVYDGPIEPITTKIVSIIIPVKDNQLGIDRFLKFFFETNHFENYPLEILIIDNNSVIPIRIHSMYLNKGLEIKLFKCVIRGPAAARNHGAVQSKGSWLLFCDSDCIPTNNFLTGYITEKPAAIVFSGIVKALGNSSLERFYDSERILMPQRKSDSNKNIVPLYIVTANTIVYKEAFIRSGHFNESFTYAGSEDVEISIRLWKIGNIAFNEKSIILHDYGNGIIDFARRFARYGKGNWQLQTMQGIEMRPTFRKPKEATIFNYTLRTIQHFCLFWGYYTERYLRNPKFTNLGLVKAKERL